MTAYKIEFEKAALKFLRKQTDAVRKRLLEPNRAKCAMAWQMYRINSTCLSRCMFVA